MANELLARHMQAILDIAADGIFGLDERGSATFLNRSAANMFGTTVGALTGQPLHEIIHADELGVTSFARCPICCPWRSSAHSGTAHLLTLDGKAFPIEYTTSPMGDDDEPRGVVVTFRDIADRLAIERLKDEFISAVSHELRTPLTSIRGALGLLGRSALDGRADRMLDIARSNTERLVRLIDDLLDLEKMRSGNVELQRSVASATSLVRDAVAVMQTAADRGGVTIVTEDVEATLFVDRSRIVQTLTNLLANAVKFSAAGTVVRVRASVDGETIAFSVEDEGRGIPREKLESIFERFQQVNGSDSRDQGGAGLGLAIARSIVGTHGGRIWAENRDPRGSIFRFTIPCVLDTSDAEPIQLRRPPVPKRVLIVDDDEDIREITAASLEVTRGWNIVSASCGSEAIKEASAQRPDAILLDVMMPDMDGPTAFRILRSNPETERIPVILLTAKIQSTDCQRYMQLGVEGVIAKPFDPFTLAERVAETLRWTD